jgi:predicted metal-dependent phosphotriesterase family hydrolase
MERIVIEVADATAKKWRASSPELRGEIAQKIDIRLAKELMVDSKEDFKHFLDEISANMQQRGLTEETLNDILKDNE